MDKEIVEIGASLQRISMTALVAAGACMPNNNSNVGITTAAQSPRAYTYTVPVYDERGRKKSAINNSGLRNSFCDENDSTLTAIHSVNQESHISSTKNEFNVNVAGTNLPAHYMKNLKTYWDDLDFGLNTYRHRLTTDPELIKEVATYTAGKIALLPAENTILELSPDNSIKFTLTFSEGRTLMVNKPTVYSEELDANEIVFSLFVDDELVSASTNDLDDFIIGFKQYLRS